MPLHLVEKVVFIVHDDLAEGGLRFGEPLAGGDKDLVLGIPVRPGILWNHDLVDEFQGDPVEILLDRQPFLDKDLGPVNAQRQRQAGKGIGHRGGCLHAPNRHHVIDPVGAANRVPGLGHHAGHGDVHRAADLVIKPERLRPEPRAVDGARQVAGERDIRRVRRNARVVLEPYALRVQQRELKRLGHQLGAFFHGRKVAVV